MTPEAPADAFPLAWPEGWTRTPPHRRQRSRFDVTPGRAREHAMHQIELLGGRNPVLSSNVTLRQDGQPYANQRRIDDPGVALYWQQRSGGQLGWRVVACDRWLCPHENIRAIGLTLEAMRGLDRWGASDMLDRAFAGFAALPTAEPARRAWWEVLEVPRSADASTVRAAYRRLARERHPDRGGSHDAMAELNHAWEEWKAHVQHA